MINTNEITFVGKDLLRPECVIATKRGDIFSSHGAGGITHIPPSGRGKLYLADPADRPEDFVPNGYSLMPDGSFLIANVGQSGGVYILHRGGSLRLFLNEVEGQSLPATNFANLDRQGRVWISVSTTAVNREESFSKDVADGYIVLVDKAGARIVADGIGFTNENKVDPSGRWLYVHETMRRALSRFPIDPAGNLGQREIVAEYGPGTYPDGFEFDADGGIWCTSILSNRVVRVTPEGSQQLIIDAGDSELIQRAERAYQNNTFSRALINEGQHSLLGNCASISFGGKDLKTVFLGALHLDRIGCFRSPVAGTEPPHWLF